MSSFGRSIESVSNAAVLHSAHPFTYSSKSFLEVFKLFGCLLEFSFDIFRVNKILLNIVILPFVYNLRETSARKFDG